MKFEFELQTGLLDAVVAADADAADAAWAVDSIAALVSASAIAVPVAVDATVEAASVEMIASSPTTARVDSRSETSAEAGAAEFQVACQSGEKLSDALRAAVANCETNEAQHRYDSLQTEQ